MENPENSVACFAKGLTMHPKADNLWSTLFLTCMNYLGEREALGQAAGAKDLNELLKQTTPALAPAPQPLQSTIDSIKAKLG
jgi:hypothetical protein